MEFNPGDVIHCQVTKADVVQEAGLKFVEKHGRIYIRQVDGLFKRRECPVQAGDQLLKFQQREVDEYTGVKEITRIMKRDLKIMITVERNDPDDNGSESTDSEHYPQIGWVDIRPGDILMLDGLQARPTLNGEIVQVIRETEKQGRWEVEIERTGERLSISGDNLYPVDGEEEETDSEEELLRIGDGSVQSKAIAPGMTMKLFKLKRKAKLNGTNVTIIRKSPEKKGNWVVRTEKDKIFAIHGNNLKHI